MNNTVNMDSVIEEAMNFVPFQGRMLGVEDGRFAHLLPLMLRKSRRYLETQWSIVKIQQYQTEILTHYLIDAISNVPAYRNLGISISKIRSEPWACLKKFPLLDKFKIQASLENYVADDFVAEECYRVVTSGSTGIPLTLLHDQMSYIENSACFYRILNDLSFEAGERVCRLYSDTTKENWGVTTLLFSGQMELAALNLTHNDFEAARNDIKKLQQFEPVGLSGNASDLLKLCLLLREQKDKIKSVRFVLSAGENLSVNMRSIIEDTLECSVRDIYSMQEANIVAWECEKGALHVNDDRVIVESILNTELNQSELVITPFTNRSMPLIRYRTGDLGDYVPWDKSPCSCGRQLGRIMDFSGRDRGFVVLRGNRLFGPKPIKALLTEQPIAAWKIVQRDLENLEILLLASPIGKPKNLISKIESELRFMLDNEINISVKWVREDEMFVFSKKFQMMDLMS